MKTAPSALVGRDRELAEIEAMLAAAAEGAGRVVVVSAGAGAGKTALLGAALDRARQDGFTVLTARGISSERDLPFGLVSRLFEPVVPELAGAGPGDGASSAELHALHRVLAQLAVQAPVFVAVDDLQCLDRQSLRWLSALPQRVEHARIAVMLTLCPGEPCADPAALDELLAVSAVELHPADLSVPATAAVIEHALAAAPDGSFVTALMREAGGNPLCVTELASVLSDQAVTPTADAASGLGDIAVPRLASRVRARLRRISPHALGIARAVAVLGAEADLARVTGVCGVEPAVVMEVTTALDRAGLLGVTGESMAFTQPLMRNTVLQHVSFADLQTLHTAAARILRSTGAPAERVADQLLAASPPAEPWAVAVLRDAAATALGRGEPARAAGYLGRALREPEPEEVRTRLLEELGRAEGYTDLDAAIGHLTAALRSPAEPEERAGAGRELAVRELAVRELAEHLTVTGRHRAAAELADGQPDSASADRALWSADLRCDGEAASEAAAEALTHLRRPDLKGGLDEGRYLSLLATRTARVGRSRSRAASLADHALAVLPGTPEAMRPTLRAVLVLAQAGRTEDAFERCDALVGHATRWGHRPCLAAALSLRGAVAHRLGRMPAAAEDARTALDLLVGCGAPRHRGAAVEFTARLVDILVDLGAYDEAAGLVEHSDVRHDVPPTWGGTALLLARGRLRVAAGQPSEGLRDLLAGGGRLPSWKTENPAVAPWRSDAATALALLGESAEARHQAADAVEQARQWGAPGPLGVALRTFGAVVGGAEGLGALEKSVVVLERSAAGLDLARSLAEYGSALSRAKRWVPARRALRAALELAEECGCADLARRSRIELSASGGRPPKASGTAGVAALTAAELRTATLAAEGRTNRELAEILLVGLRTVEVHLTNAYRKLGIDGREHLPAVLHGPALPRGDTPSRAGSR